MSQSLTIGGTITLVNNNLRTLLNLTDTITTTSSNSITNNANINTSSWQVLDQGSNSNLRYAFFTNLDATSSCLIAMNTTATSSYSALLQPGDVCIMPNSGSTILYAKATGSNPTIVLQYVATSA